MEKKKSWRARITDSTGTARWSRPLLHALDRTLEISNRAHADIPVRCIELGERRISAHWNHDEEALWIDATGIPDVTPEVADLPVRCGSWPVEFPLRIGGTTIEWVPIHPAHELPPTPRGCMEWWTQSPLGRELLWELHRSAATPLSIYLEGETGVGKEVLARLAHHWSARARGPFIPLHCAALSLSLVESELFGHVKGAYTGAHTQRQGALMQAHRGTLFLDEVGDLPPAVQIKLLRFLENGEIRPVGSDTVVRADVRIVCATHLPLDELVEQGKFRRDLFYRLASIKLRIAPLRQRPDDILLLAQGFAERFDRRVSAPAARLLRQHHWPGNARELQHAIERACANRRAKQGAWIQLRDFDFLERQVSESPLTNPHRVTHDTPAPINLKEMERRLLLQALKSAQGNRKNAARMLGVARSTLFDMLKRHDLGFPNQSAVQSRLVS